MEHRMAVKQFEEEPFPFMKTRWPPGVVAVGYCGEDCEERTSMAASKIKDNQSVEAAVAWHREADTIVDEVKGFEATGKTLEQRVTTEEPPAPPQITYEMLVHMKEEMERVDAFKRVPYELVSRIRKEEQEALKPKHGTYEMLAQMKEKMERADTSKRVSYEMAAKMLREEREAQKLKMPEAEQRELVFAKSFGI